MNRREFLRNLTLVSSAVSAPTFLVKHLKAAKALEMTAQAADPGRILVVCELAGGTDGLNTVVPYRNDFYYQQRPQLAIPPQSVLTLDDDFGFHPRMTGFKGLFDDGHLAVVHGIGYPNPNRSHFFSADIFHSANPETANSDGWLAQYVDTLPERDALSALSIGGGVPKALISDAGASPGIRSIETYRLETDAYHPDDAQNKNSAFQQILAQPQNRFDLQQFVGQTALDATLTSVELLEGNDQYQSDVVYPDGAFAENLRTVARIIAADLGVRVFYVSIGGFDTHADQALPNSSVQGFFADLIGQVSDTISAFWSDVEQMGRQDEVLVLTFSEFGRRLFENGSNGTDHGTANQMMLIGSQVEPGLHGTHPSLAPGDLDDVGDMIFTRDFREVYATALGPWLGVDPGPILGPQFAPMDILRV